MMNYFSGQWSAPGLQFALTYSHKEEIIFPLNIFETISDI